jgi:hypothetical protein
MVPLASLAVEAAVVSVSATVSPDMQFETPQWCRSVSLALMSFPYLAARRRHIAAVGTLDSICSDPVSVNPWPELCVVNAPSQFHKMSRFFIWGLTVATALLTVRE